MKIKNEALLKAAAALDTRGNTRSADVIDGFLRARAVVAQSNTPVSDAQVQDQVKNQFMLDFGSTYHLIQNTTQIDAQSKAALLGVFNQINRMIGHTQASVLAVRTVVAQPSDNDPLSVRQQYYAVSLCIQSVKNVMTSAQQIRGYNNVYVLLQQALTILNGLTTRSNPQEVLTQIQSNQQANQQALVKPNQQALVKPNQQALAKPTAGLPLTK